MDLQLPVLVLLSCSLIIPALLIVVTLRYYAKELSQQHNSITFKKSQSYLQWWYAVVVELLELWMRSLKKKITKSLTGMCHPNKMGFHPFILHFIQATAECFFFFLSCYNTVSPSLFFFFVARKITGNSLFSAVRYMEYGIVTGGNGYWQIPDSSS